MSRRLPGATDSERLTLSTIKDSDQLTTRHNPGILDDVDLGTAKKILQATPVFACTSAAASAAKTAFLQDSFPDFELVNGRTIIVYMANANTAANPTLNVQYTDAIPLDGDYWQAGTFIKCQYVDITVNGNRIRRWVMDQGANNVKTQLNGALADYQKTANYLFASNTPLSKDSLCDSLGLSKQSGAVLLAISSRNIYSNGVQLAFMYWFDNNEVGLTDVYATNGYSLVEIQNGSIIGRENIFGFRYTIALSVIGVIPTYY